MSTRNGCNRTLDAEPSEGSAPPATGLWRGKLAAAPRDREAGGLVGRRLAGRPPYWDVHRYWLPQPGVEGDAPPDPDSPAQPVLLIHAATLGRRMFLEPEGGFVAHLLRQREKGQPRFDVFTLDWRSSNLLFGPAGECLQGPDRPSDVTSCYRIDKAAEDDLPAGLAAVARARPGAPIHLVAHCMGAAVTAQALACQSIGNRDDPAQPPLGRIVLATIALFYRLGVDGWLKVADNIIAELESEGVEFLSPHLVFDAFSERCRWPESFERMFDTWKQSLFSHGCRTSFCDRLWFLYGGDYRANDMMNMHDGSGEQGLDGQFGAMPIGLYRHIIENCRRGWAARWEVSPRTHPYELFNPEGFRGKDITLVTGSENQVWHRDSIDRMYEWLQRPRRRPGDGGRFRKRVFERYGHVDLWWSSEAPAQVFPYLADILKAC
jgi:lysosomal acid lipase/cholesteryl ester hydrolase